MFFFFNDTATTEIYTLSLHDALPISSKSAADILPIARSNSSSLIERSTSTFSRSRLARERDESTGLTSSSLRDRKSTRLNSSHANISNAVFCLKKNKTSHHERTLSPS